MRKGCRPTADGKVSGGRRGSIGLIGSPASLGRNVSLTLRAGTKKAAVAGHIGTPHAPGMFAITEAEAAAIRTVFEERGEFAAAVALRRLFPGITDNTQARECVRTIAGLVASFGRSRRERDVNQRQAYEPRPYVSCRRRRLDLTQRLRSSCHIIIA